MHHLRPMDDRVPVFNRLGEDLAPVILVNIFAVGTGQAIGVGRRGGVVPRRESGPAGRGGRLDRALTRARARAHGGRGGAGGDAGDRAGQAAPRAAVRAQSLRDRAGRIIRTQPPDGRLTLLAADERSLNFLSGRPPAVRSQQKLALDTLVSISLPSNLYRVETCSVEPRLFQTSYF